MDYTAEERALIWLCGCTDLDPRERAALLRAAGDSAEKLFADPLRYSSAVGEEKRGLFRESANARKGALSAFLEELGRKGRFAVTCASADYPVPLGYAGAFPPLVLFGEGNRALLKEKIFCIVGSRRTPPWASALGTKIAAELSGHFAVATGLAEGGDLSAVRGALPNGRLICVLPCGLDVCYPAAHAAWKEQIAEKGLLLSEFPPRETVKKYSFHLRNRILAGISEGTLILSAGEKSGALITAGYALDFGRDLFAVPYNPGVEAGEGCDRLLKTGAYVCTSAEDILEQYGIEEEAAPCELTEEERETLTAFRGEGELHAAVLAERLGRPVFEVAAVLSALEIKGLIVKAGGNRYSVVSKINIS